MPHLALEDWQILLEAPPEALRPRQGDALRHLLGCPRCRRLLDNTLSDFDFDPMPGAEPAPNLWQMLTRFALARVEAGGRPRLEIPLDDQLSLALCQELLDLPASSRLEVLDASARFRTLGVAESLLSKAEKAAQTDQPLQSHDLALLAVFILERLQLTSRVSDLFGLAYCLLGEAERRRGHLGSAEDHLANAVRLLGDEPLSLTSRTRLCFVLGRLRKDQARTDEALALFERSRRLSEDLGLDTFQAAAALDLGSLLLDEDDPDSALPVLWEAYHLSSERRDLPFIVTVLEALVLATAETGRRRDLPTILQALKSLRPRLDSEPLEQIRITWIEARLDWYLGNSSQAIDTLDRVFTRLLELDVPFQAADAALELAAWKLTAGVPPQDLVSLAGALEPLPLPDPVRFVIRFSLLFPVLSDRRGSFMDVLESAQLYLVKAQFDPELPFLPLPDPDLVLSWHELNLEQRLQAARNAHIQVDRKGEPGTLEDFLLVAWTHEALTGVRIYLPDRIRPPGPNGEEDATWPG